MTRGNHEAAENFFIGGEMAEKINRVEWSQTSLGDIGNWQQSLRTAVQIILDARVPLIIWWGENLIQIHNEAARAALGEKAVGTPGAPAREIWSQVWGSLEPLVAEVSRDKVSLKEIEIPVPTGNERRKIFAFSLAPIFDDERKFGGVLVQLDQKEENLTDIQIARLVDSRFNKILDRITDGFLSFDTEWNFTYLNRTGAETLGRTPEELRGKNLWTEFPELRETEFGKMYLRAVEENIPLSRQGFYEPFNAWFDARAYPSESGLSLFFVDITETRKAAEALRQSERQLRMITDALPVLISYLDADHYYRFANKSYYEWFGKTAEQIIGKHLSEIVGEKAYRNVLGEIETVLSGKEVSFEQWMPYRENFQKYIYVNYIPDFDVETRRVKGFYALVRDITAEREIQDRLRESEAHLRLALDISQTSTFEIDLLTDAVETDELGRQIYGWSLDEPLTFSKVQAHFHPEDKDQVVERVNSALAPEGSDEFEIDQRIIRTNGETRWIRVRGRGLFEGAGDARRAVRCIGTYIDITQQKRRENNVRFLAEIGEDFARLSDFYEIIRVVGEKIKNHLRALRVAFAEICESKTRMTFLYNRHQADGVEKSEEFDLTQYMSEDFLRELQNGQTVAINDIRTDPRTARYASMYEPFEVLSQIDAPYSSDGEWKFMLAVQYREPREWRADEIEFIRELSGRLWIRLERAKTEEKLRQSEERYRNLANAMPQLVWTANADGVVDYYNTLVENYDGIEFDEKSNRWKWQLMLHPEDIMLTEKAWREAQQTGVYQCEHRVLMKNGAYCWHLSRALAVRDGRGGIVKWFGTATDVDEIKSAQDERERLLVSEQAARLQAEQANRLKDEFLATVSHELRTPLNAILGWATMARGADFAAEEAQRAFEVIERSARNQNQIISDILDVSRIITGKLNLEINPVALVPVIQNAIDTMRPALQAKKIRLATDFDASRLEIAGDFNRLQQIVWNLLSNAVKFTPEEGEIRISLRYSETSAEITVTDSGKGIAPDFLPYVFDRFRQADAGSNRKYGGLGLGLSIVKHLVEMHGGQIFAASEGLGRGSAFTVRLPVHATKSGTKGETSGRQGNGAEIEYAFQKRGGKEGALSPLRILVVDDEADSLEIAVLMLKMQGARVVSASSTEDALKKLAEDSFDLLISDIGMPIRDGYDLIRSVRQSGAAREKSLPAIALTAYAAKTDGERALAAGFQAHLPKPVEMNKLIETIKDIVNEL